MAETHRYNGVAFQMDRRGRTFVNGSALYPEERLLWAMTNELTSDEGTKVREVNQLLDLIGKEGLEQIGKGADMIAYSRPDLNFVIKFPYDDDDSVMRPYFNERVERGFSLAKARAGKLFAPMTDVPTEVIDKNGKPHLVSVIIQHKTEVTADRMDRFRAEGNAEGIVAIERDFIDLSERAWRICLIDQDPNWMENTGFMPDGRMVMFDVGEITNDGMKFDKYEGMDRRNCYVGERLRRVFDMPNFAEHYGKEMFNWDIVPKPELMRI